MKEEILDATCGGRTIWLPGNKEREDTLYIDNREEDEGFTGQENRTYNINPDQIQDFRNLPYENESFSLIVFDPPHILKENGMKNLSGYIEKSYGCLNAETWQNDLEKGFEELFRLLKPRGVLVFKFAETHINFKDVLDLAPVEPLFGTPTKQKSNIENRFFVFQKTEVDK